MVKASVVADDDHEVRELQRKLRWAEEDNERLWRLLDEALDQLRAANNRVVEITHERAADAHAHVVEAEERLARATLAAREPNMKLH
jgi:hypothetical protein